MQREILTLQVGNYSNYVATHFWNSQQYVESDGLHTEQLNPRTVIIDRKGAYNIGGDVQEEAYDLRQDTELTDFLEELDSPERKATYSDSLKNQVKRWSDYNAIYHDPKAFMELPQFTHLDPTNRLATFTRGFSCFDENNFGEDLMDTVRRYMEATDNAQGFQLFLDINDGFSGLGCRIVEELVQEYGKKTILSFGIADAIHGTHGEQHVTRVNQALTLSYLMELDTLYLPLHIDNYKSPYLKPFTTRYESSGLLAACIETATIAKNGVRLGDVERLLNPQLRTSLLGLGLGMPIPIQDNALFSKQQTASITTVRGPLNVLKSLSPVLETLSNAKTFQYDAFPVDPSFPQLTLGIDHNGMIGESDLAVQHLPILTTMYSGRPLEGYLTNMLNHLDLARRDTWLRGEFALGDDGKDDTQWLTRYHELQEIQARYQE
ncbi:Tubulin/FtsZ, GTPase domain-containing protein [Gorgonomyces haynaldii]|nr:Tubulin/FtsZ, GTPase domain-containing protein [Gorgonomyces haynaldii]